MQDLQAQAGPLVNQLGQAGSPQDAKDSKGSSSQHTATGSSSKTGLDAMSLAKWNKLAERGGIGKAVALSDCMADRKGDLMFLAGDEITILRALSEEVFLGYCEGVIGRFYRPQVRFNEVQSRMTSTPDVLTTSSSESSAEDKTVVEDLPIQDSTSENAKVSDQSIRAYLKQEGANGHHESAMQNDISSPHRTNGGSTFEENLGETESAFENSSPQMSVLPEQSEWSHCNRSRPESKGVADQNAPLASASPPIASTWSHRPSVDTHTQIKAESVAMALRSFGGGTEREEEESFGRSRQSRDSSLDGSECSWSSTHESDEISEGSIHYPTISFIDRLKASRIPATQLANAQPTIQVASANPPSEEKPVNNDVADVAEPSSRGPSMPIVVQPSPPPRPKKSRLRSQPAGEMSGGMLSESSTGIESKDVDSEKGHGNASMIARAETLSEHPLILEDESTQGSRDATSDHTRESNPFEFGIGVSAASTPSGIMTPAIEDAGIQPSSQLNETLLPSEHAGIPGQMLTVPEATAGGALARELANRFSSNSEILRKHHINEDGDQSYFPIVPLEEASTTAKAESPSISDSKSVQLDPPEPVPEDVRAAPIPNDTAACLPILASPILEDSRTRRVETHGLGLESQDNNDSWNILDDYVDRSPPAAATPQFEDSLALKSVSIPADELPVVNTVETPVVKKKASGILKIRTPAQPDNSPQSILTPTSVRAFQQTSPEGSMSPDTHRFRAFAMNFPSPSQTPTKSNPVKQLSTPSSGRKSAEATKLVQEDTLHGQLAMDLTSARNPVPINFLLGQSTGSPIQTVGYSAVSHTPPQGYDRGSPSPANGKHSPKAPSSPFFPTRSDKPRARSFSIVEVPLPLHRSDSSNSLKTAYAGILQNGHVANQQRPVDEKDKVRRSLSRKSSAKLSAFRRKLSLRSEDRPDMSSIIADNTQPPLPTSDSRRPSTATEASVEGQPWKDAHGLESHSLPPLPSTPKVKGDISPVPIPASGVPPPTPILSPKAKAASPKSAMITPSKSPTAQPTAGPVYDQYGYLAEQSPIPPFAAPRISDREITKLEQTLLSLTDRPATSSSRQKAKAIVETYLPPSVRGRVWSWLLNAPSLSHQRYQLYIDSFVIPRLEIDPSLVVRFGNHRAFMHGFQSVQQMIFLYITRHQHAPPPPDTIWIASVFLTQSLHEADAYALYESFLGRISECWTSPQLRQWAQVLQEAIQAHDPELATYLANCPDLYYTVLRRWCLTMFAEAMPLPTCLRAMDLVIAQGTPAILKLASVVILLCAKRLLAIANPADMMAYLRQPSQEWLSPENVISNMGKIALPKSSLPKIGSPRT